MIHDGQIVLFRFPQTDEKGAKLRAALLIRKVPGPYDDWLICMISTQLSRQMPEFDELLDEKDPDFEMSGLKASSVIRISRLAVVDKRILLGSIGEIAEDRLSRIKSKIADWIRGT